MFLCSYVLDLMENVQYFGIATRCKYIVRNKCNWINDLKQASKAKQTKTNAISFFIYNLCNIEPVESI